MKVLCVDDEKLILDALVARCSEIDFVEKVLPFRSGTSALEYFKNNKNEYVDAAVLDIDMPDIGGLELAKKLKEILPQVEIIFATGFSQYAVDAFKTRASGYLLKPVSKEDLLEELTVVKNKKSKSGGTDALIDENKGIYAKTFGNFDLLVNGKPVQFKWKKAKEVLAYLIDRSGSIVTRKDLSGILFDDDAYTRSNQTYISKIIAKLTEDLKEAGAEEIFVKGNDAYSVDTTKLGCDSWEFLNGINLEKYHGEYMMQYSWAELSIGKFEK